MLSFYPKISFILDKFKILLKDSYNNYIENIKKLDTEIKERNFIADDIMNFILKLAKKYKTNINGNLICQLEKEDEFDQIKIIKQIFSLLFNIYEYELNEVDEDEELLSDDNDDNIEIEKFEYSRDENEIEENYCFDEN